MDALLGRVGAPETGGVAPAAKVVGSAWVASAVVVVPINELRAHTQGHRQRPILVLLFGRRSCTRRPCKGSLLASAGGSGRGRRRRSERAAATHSEARGLEETLPPVGTPLEAAGADVAAGSVLVTVAAAAVLVLPVAAAVAVAWRLARSCAGRTALCS